jgi:hypothetical protein
VVHNMDVSSVDDIADRRWIVLGEDGRFITLGRATNPSAAEIIRAEDGLCAQGLAGWLAIMSGSPYLARPPTLLMVRPLAAPNQKDASMTPRRRSGPHADVH